MWRLVLEQRATYAEIERFWTVEEVMVANDLLNAWHAAGRRAAEKAKTPKGGGRR